MPLSSVPMSTTIRNAADAHRFEIVVDCEGAGFAEYRSRPGVRTFVHTVIDERFEGQGLAGQLVRAALDATRAEGLAVEPVCSYVQHYIAGHAEYVDLVPSDARSRFGLAPD